MPYRESIFFPKNYFHIFCRGNEKRNIFLDANDYEHFLSKMKNYKEIHKVTVVCYCLMPNHFHLLLRQNVKEPLYLFVHRLTVSHAMYFNKRYNRVGHLFQGRFKAKLIPNDEYLLHLSRYIHLNPLEIINSRSALETYPWSSYFEYISKSKKEEICEKEIVLQQFNNFNPQEEYKKFVYDIISENELIKIKNFAIEVK
jgi:REP element-mobilizing transposase RayT